MKKRVLIAMLTTVAFVLVMSPLAIRAQSDESQCYKCVLYLTDADETAAPTKFFLVTLDSATSIAYLTPMPAVGGYNPGELPFPIVHALAATPDGKKVYAVDRYNPKNPYGTGKLGYYEVGTASWYEIDYVTHGGNIVESVVLLAFSPDGTLYGASGETESLYIIDTGTAVATLVGQILNGATGVAVNIVGGDIVFAADGTLYLWVNSEKPGSPRGLYLLTLPATIPGTVDATYLGTTDTERFFPGLAMKKCGYGNLVVSCRDELEDKIFVLDKTSSSIVETYPMDLSGAPFDHINGDMTYGREVFCTRTIGYWKNHSWDGMVITICDVEVDEELGQVILWNANGSNFSMLFAQLIAAKLNTYDYDDSNCIDCDDVIVDAEWWLCEQQDIINPDGSLNWDKTFDSCHQKYMAAYYWERLDYCNNKYECEDDDDTIITAHGLGGRSLIKEFDNDGNYIRHFRAFGPPNTQGEVHLAIGDIDRDGLDEIAAGQGEGGNSIVKLFEIDGTFISKFKAFGQDNSQGEVHLVIGNFDAVGSNYEIAVAHGEGGQSMVKIFRADGTFMRKFIAFGAPNAQGEVHLAAADLENDDGIDEIIAGMGEGGSSAVKIFSHLGTLIRKFRAFGPVGNPGGEVHVAVGNFDADADWEIAVATGYNGGNLVKLFEKDGTFIRWFRPFGFGGNSNGEVQITATDIDSDGIWEIICAHGEGGSSLVKVFKTDGTLVRKFRAFGPSNSQGEVHLGTTN